VASAGNDLPSAAWPELVDAITEQARAADRLLAQVWWPSAHDRDHSYCSNSVV
jgi:hypothetical protein